MDVDITQPPPPLPTPEPVRIASGVSLLPPLTRRGYGPGLILLTPNSTTSLQIQDGVPSPLMKWAEEGYVVIEVQESVLGENPTQRLNQAVEELSRCGKCESKGCYGLVSYASATWNRIAADLPSISGVRGAVVYANATEGLTLAQTPVPCLRHFAGRLTVKLERTDTLTSYDYSSAKSASFAIPFQDDFSYSLEAVSHTRNLTFLKRLMNGPYFDLEAIWEEHTMFEFGNRSVEWTMSTMVQEPYVNHIPTMTGGVGREDLTKFYRDHFIFSNPADAELEPISRTVGTDRVVDEFIYRCTHDSQIDWLIPGIPPTHRKLEIPMMAVVNIRGDRLYHEHIMWDQGTVLMQLGLMPLYLSYPYKSPDGKSPGPGSKVEVKTPAGGIDTATKMRDRDSLPSNRMFEFKMREVNEDGKGSG